MQFSPEFSFFFLGPSIFLNILFLNTLRLCPSLKEKDQVSWPYKTAAANLYSPVFISKCLDNKQDDKKFWTEQKQDSDRGIAL